MKILWVKTDFLHPTTRGGQIRTLEMLRELHKRHEVHYVAFDDPSNPEGVRRSSEYSAHAYPVPHRLVSKRSPRFAGQLLAGLFSKFPVSGMRYRSRAMRDTIAKLVCEQDFDAKVCDFLFPSINIDNMNEWVLFQHNVETLIWERHAQTARTLAHRIFFGLQARRMLEWERSVALSASHVIAVSDIDEQIMRERFAISYISSISTGVDLDYFERPASTERVFDLVFAGSMDWMPNVDGTRWFVSEVLPLIRARRPDCRVAIAGKNPPPSLIGERKDPLLTVTGTVPDIRPYLWGSAVSIVPLRVGGGTRLKIFEAMAAETPVVSTTIGSEGLPVEHGKTVRIADTPGAFAAECLDLLSSDLARSTLAANALALVRANFSWEQVTRRFEQTLRSVHASTIQTA